MQIRRMAAVVFVTAVLIIGQIFPVQAMEEEKLHALSAVLKMEKTVGFCTEKKNIKPGPMPAPQKL